MQKDPEGETNPDHDEKTAPLRPFGLFPILGQSLLRNLKKHF